MGRCAILLERDLHPSEFNNAWGVHPISFRLRIGESIVMTKTEISDCLRDLQTVPTVPRIAEEQIAELLKKELILRAGKTGGIWLTQLGMYTKTGQI